MGTAFNNLSLLKNHDTIGVSYGRQTMCDNKGCSSAHQLIHTILNNALGTGIDGACRLIENQYRRICNGCTRDRKKLPLTLGQIRTVSGQHCVIALRQTHNESVRIRQFCCCYNLILRRIELSEGNIFSYRSRKQMCILQNNAKRSSQVILFDLSNVDLIVTNLTFLNIIEAVDQIGNGCLSGSGRTDKRDLLTRLCKQRYIVQNNFIRVVAEINMFEYHTPCSSR